MKYQGPHPSDQQLLLDLEGEHPPNAAKQIRAHIDSCWTCRERRQELEGAMDDFISAYHQEMDAKIPPLAGPRALLKVRLAEISATGARSSWFALAGRSDWALAVATCGLVVAAIFLTRSAAGHYSRSNAKAAVVSIPDPSLTPGATILATRLVVCAQSNTKNKAVPVELQRKVFEEYGIAGAEPRAYEVDYLVTPALGGADDIRNLWPHSYSATRWNAQVKDALEDRLREMVCEGSLDLMKAQKEIAADWIAAYKKYFHTEEPLAQHYKPETPNWMARK
jgi:hypothetical protein